MNSEEPVLDLTQIEEIKSMPGRHGPSLLPEFMALFYRDEPPRLSLLARLTSERRYSEMMHPAHTLAGSCALLGAIELRQAALELQAASEASAEPAVAEKMAHVQTSWTRLQQALKAQGLTAL